MGLFRWDARVLRQREAGRTRSPSRRAFGWGGRPSTQQAYQRVTGKTPASHKGANLPVEEVDWNEAQAYCKAIGGRAADRSGVEYRGAGRFHGCALRQSG